MTRGWAALSLLPLFLVFSSTANAEPKASFFELPAAPQSVWSDGERLGVLLKNGKAIGLTRSAKRAAPPPREEPKAPKDGLPDGILTTGSKDIRKAWLTRPTRRYGHAVLGDGVEAGGVAVETKTGEVLEYVLPETEVFEDRLARIADLDGDGLSEVVIVNSHADFGAALAVIAVSGGKLALIARTPFIGTSHRWLNPAGIADFDGDGRKEVAIVVTPHIGGTLQFWELEGGTLKLQAKKYGFSNHFIGSRIQAMSVVVGKSSPALVLPGADRKNLFSISLNGGKIKENWRKALDGRVMTEIVVLRANTKSPAIAAGLSNRSVMILD